MKTPHPDTNKLIETYKIINSILLVVIVGFMFVHWLIANSLTKAISTARQQAQTEAMNAQALQDEAKFFENNQEMTTTVDRALPNQNDIILVVKKVESLFESQNIVGSFNFTSLVPSQESNQYYVPFSIKMNTDIMKCMDFLRRFEKIPYLTKITSINLKTPNGVGGAIDISISGKVYVQDSFKN